jgi:hypothetical protein
MRSSPRRPQWTASSRAPAPHNSSSRIGRPPRSGSRGGCARQPQLAESPHVAHAKESIVHRLRHIWRSLRRQESVSVGRTKKADGSTAPTDDHPRPVLRDIVEPCGPGVPTPEDFNVHVPVIEQRIAESRREVFASRGGVPIKKSIILSFHTLTDI